MQLSAYLELDPLERRDLSISICANEFRQHFCCKTLDVGQINKNEDEMADAGFGILLDLQPAFFGWT